MSPEPFVSRAKAPPAKRNERAMGTRAVQPGTIYIMFIQVFTRNGVRDVEIKDAYGKSYFLSYYLLTVADVYASSSLKVAHVLSSFVCFCFRLCKLFLKLSIFMVMMPTFIFIKEIYIKI